MDGPDEVRMPRVVVKVSGLEVESVVGIPLLKPASCSVAMGDVMAGLMPMGPEVVICEVESAVEYGLLNWGGSWGGAMGDDMLDLISRLSGEVEVGS